MNRNTFRSSLHISAAVAISIGVGTGAHNAAAQTLTDPGLAIETVTGPGTLNLPTNMVILASNDFLVGQKNNGQVKRVLNGTVQPTAVLDLPVSSGGERGLLGMVKHPNFATNSFIYAYYTRATADGGSGIDNRISRFTWNGTALTSELPIFAFPTPATTHNGGILRFGPPDAPAASQKLFAVMGDGQLSGQNQNVASGAAPDNTGVIIRINDDGSIPTGAEKGPFFDVAGSNDSLKIMYAYGIRNCYGMDFDPVSSALWEAENGPEISDEINRVDPAFNGGWRTVKGNVNPLPTGLVQYGGVGTYSNPEFTWQTTIAPTAIHFYRGTAIGSAYQYDCFMGCSNNGKLYHFEMNPARTGFVLPGNLADLTLSPGDSDAPIVIGNDWGAITDIQTGPDGNLYVLSLSNGAIYRIRNAATSVNEWSVYE